MPGASGCPIAGAGCPSRVLESSRVGPRWSVVRGLGVWRVRLVLEARGRVTGVSVLWSGALAAEAGGNGDARA